MPAALPCKTRINGRGETCRRIGKHKTKYACVVDADESMRIRLEEKPQRYHEYHIAAIGINSRCRYYLVHKFVPMPQALKIPDAKAAEENMGKTLENTSMAADKGQKQERSDR